MTRPPWKWEPLAQLTSWQMTLMAMGMFCQLQASLQVHLKEVRSPAMIIVCSIPQVVAVLTVLSTVLVTAMVEQTAQLSRYHYRTSPNLILGRRDRPR